MLKKIEDIPIEELREDLAVSKTGLHVCRKLRDPDNNPGHTAYLDQRASVEERSIEKIEVELKRREHGLQSDAQVG